MTVILSLSLAYRTNEKAKEAMTTVVVVLCVGALAVYLNANFLGSSMYGV